jgi:drug/metabolite transporter (DMT)-like permease
MLIHEIVAIGTSICLNASAQIFLRLGMRDSNVGTLLGERDFVAVFQAVANPYVLSGLGCYVVSVFMWMYVLSRTPVSVAYPLVSMVYVIVVLSGWFFLGESFSWMRLFGVGVILCGVWIVARSA